MLDINEPISSSSLLMQFLQHLQFDDVIAIATVVLASALYQTSGTLWNRQDPYHYKLFEKPQQKASSRGFEKRQTRDLAQRLELEDKDVAILWASQSGTAERFAGRLAKELRGYFNAKVLLVDISDVEPMSISKIPSSKLAIFIASTFGEGDPSDNMHECWSWLHQLPDGLCSNLRFLALGLGNSNYRHYNAVIDEVVEFLQASGAQLLIPLGRADDAHGETEEHFLGWKQDVFEFFKSSLGYQEREMPYDATFSITEDESLSPSGLNTGAPVKRKLVSGESETTILPIIKSSELLRNNSDRGCLHLEFDLTKAPQLKYKTGDYLAVWPINPSSEVQRLLRVLGLDENRSTPIRINPLEATTTKVPILLTYETLLRNHLEICAPVSRGNVEILASFAPDQHARNFLMGKSRDKDTYAKYLESNYINLGILLENACHAPGAWKDLPLSLVLEILPMMQARSYSISSSSVVHPRQVAITVATAGTLADPSAARAPGLTTNYLTYVKDGNHPRGMEYGSLNADESLSSGNIRCFLRRSNFKLPGLASAPIVMVGAGTGVAPFRAFVQERARLAIMGRVVGATKLIFGCRNSAEDQIYADEFAEWSEQLGETFTMDLAFSRPKDSRQKKYVQDVIRERAETIYHMLVNENAYFYICGSAAMARGVSETVAEIISTRKNWDAPQMKEFADQQKRQKRWLQDAWG